MRDSAFIAKLDELLRLCKEQTISIGHVSRVLDRKPPSESNGTQGNNDTHMDRSSEPVSPEEITDGKPKAKDKRTLWKDFSIADRIQSVIAILTLIALAYSIIGSRTAQRAVLQAHEQFVIDQRPYLWIDTKVPEYNFKLRFEAPDQTRPDMGRIATDILFRNYGKSPAVGVRSAAYISTSPDPENDIDWSGLPQLGEAGIYPPNETFAKTSRTKTDVSIQLTQSRPITDLRGPNVVWALHVLIIYSDQSGSSYTSELCQVMQINGLMKRCTKHNKLE